MMISQVFIDVGCGNFTGSDGIDYGGRTSYTVSSCKESFYVAYGVEDSATMLPLTTGIPYFSNPCDSILCPMAEMMI